METQKVPAATAATQERFERMKRRLKGLYGLGSVSVSLVQKRMQALCMPDASPLLSELTLGTFVSLSTGRAHKALRPKLLVRTLTLYRLLHAAQLA
jgi:Na+-transporting methylmalonyl-CoA/oxaloacetate decarboxylase beta subunit